MDGNRHPQKGFTLLEIIVVMFIISIVFGISTVMVSRSFPSSKADATVRELIAAIRQVRGSAMAHGERQVMLINFEARNYGIEGKNPRTWPEEVTVFVSDPLAGEIRHGEYRYIFYPTGASEGGTIVVTGGRKNIRLDLDPVVGAVSTRAEER